MSKQHQVSKRIRRNVNGSLNRANQAVNKVMGRMDNLDKVLNRIDGLIDPIGTDTLDHFEQNDPVTAKVLDQKRRKVDKLRFDLSRAMDKLEDAYHDTVVHLNQMDQRFVELRTMLNQCQDPELG